MRGSNEHVPHERREKRDHPRDPHAPLEADPGHRQEPQHEEREGEPGEEVGERGLTPQEGPHHREPDRDRPPRPPRPSATARARNRCTIGVPPSPPEASWAAPSPRSPSTRTEET